MQKKSLWVLWVAVFFLSFTSQVDAQTYRPRKTHKVSREVPRNESPWYIFVGADLGGVHYSAYNSSVTEAPRTGAIGGVRLLLAHYWYNWVADAGIGYLGTYNSGTNSDGSTNSDNTRTAHGDLSVRYRFSDFQVGPELEYWFNTDDGLNPTLAGTNTIATTANTSTWLGLQGLYEWTDNQKYRLGLRWLYDISVSNRPANVLQVFFQFGFPVFNGSQDEEPATNYERVNADDLDKVESRNTRDPLVMSPEATPWPSATPAAPEPEPEVFSTPVPPPEPEPTVIPAATPEPTPEAVNLKHPPKVILTLDVNDLPFGFNNSDLPPSNAARVVKIGEFLQKNNKDWKSLVIAGNTDERGTKEYNLKLSKKRADTVKQLLVAGGANKAKIKTVGYGKSKPVDRRHNEKAWAKNRRVELEFGGVKDVILMKKAMAQ